MGAETSRIPARDHRFPGLRRLGGDAILRAGAADLTVPPGTGMQMEGSMTKDASVGGILGELVSVLERSARDVAIYVLVLGGITAFGVLAGLAETTAGTLDYGFRVDANDSAGSALFEFFSAVASLFGTYLLLARMLAAGGRLGVTGGRFWPYLGMTILSVIAIVLGLFLVIVPGIILLVRWSAASGFVIGAGESATGSLSASWNATKGHGWAIFFASLILLVAIAVCYGVVGVIAGTLGLDGSPADVLAAFVETAASGLFAGFGIAIYNRCAGEDAQGLSKVFA
jgi:hypothetical protein